MKILSLLFSLELVALFFPVLQVLARPLEDIDVASLLGDVTESVDYRYGLTDSSGLQMDCVHVDQILSEEGRSVVEGDSYYGVYHAMVGTEYQVRLATSTDLMNWKFRKVLISNADMPYVKRVEESNPSSWIMLAHEQWMSPDSTVPSQLGFKLYSNESTLLAPGGDFLNSFIAPFTVGERSIEGTPSIYSANVVDGFVEADIGFHFNDENGIDRVAHGQLANFGLTTRSPTMTGEVSEEYNLKFEAQGGIGNIGQRAPGWIPIDGSHLVIQEANIGSMPPTIWEDWRVWLYYYGEDEGDVPLGREDSSIMMLDLKTHGGSTAVGNPSFSIVSCPDDKSSMCLFVSYFLFGEGAAEGEAGVVAFFKRLP